MVHRKLYRRLIEPRCSRLSLTVANSWYIIYRYGQIITSKSHYRFLLRDGTIVRISLVIRLPGGGSHPMLNKVARGTVKVLKI